LPASDINLARVFIGGLVAGVVANVLDFVVNEYVLAEDMHLLIQRFGLSDAVGPGVAVTWIVVDFVLGILLVWTYAAIRPRFGPGPRTAIAAGLTIFAAITAVMAGFTRMGLFATPLFLKASAFLLVTLCLASVAGAWLYKE
jgi:hypothetical protein